MKQHQEKEPVSRSVQDAIRQVLMNDWDPIGIKNTYECRDEYDRYIGGVYRLLASGADENQLADHLARIESERMSLTPAKPAELTKVARKLMALGIHVHA